MDAMHEKGIKSFPAKTEGKGNQPMAPKMVGGVKVFELTAEKIRWEVEPGRTVDKVCRGTLISRAMYTVDINEWGFEDGRERERKQRGGDACSPIVTNH